MYSRLIAMPFISVAFSPLAVTSSSGFTRLLLVVVLLLLLLLPPVLRSLALPFVMIPSDTATLPKCVAGLKL